MSATQAKLDPSHGQLLVKTGVAGRASKMGHRLTIVMDRWEAAVTWDGTRPKAVELTVEVDSLRVVQGEGGMTPLTAPEKTLIRANALKCLDSSKHPLIRFTATDIAPTDDGYRLTGELEIHGRTKQHVITVAAAEDGGSWQVSADTQVRHSDFGVRRYSMLMGAMQVADEVTVSFTGTADTAGSA
ncbi:YceI family protein [Mycolicibacter arupensis]|jgi:polyisoprenoid-binding protein YceI|uniref:YceI family protein n=1 Tax=Mycolicibacter arupensis TaxID=342002 RepID=UPI00122C4E6E|nr:YceI family protein [Mycolicibacter arupensis]KAA1432401.1 YceI family protein [Mycolicibacter arupensis]